MKYLEPLIILAIIIFVVVKPNALVELNSTMLGKIILLGSLIISTLYKPYIGLLILLLIVCLTIIREGFEDNIEEDKEVNIENEEQLAD